jgi:hypothetical protein
MIFHASGQLLGSSSQLQVRIYSDGSAYPGKAVWRLAKTCFNAKNERICALIETGYAKCI